jgi:hypothetical protein
MALNLSENQAARVRQVYMLSGIRQGLSGNAIIDSLRALGLGQRTSTMQAQIASLVGRPGPLPSLDADTLTALYDSSPVALFSSRSSQNYVYSFQFQEGTEVTGSYVPDTWSITSPFLLPDQLALSQALDVLELSPESEGEIGPEDIKILKTRKFTPFNP